MSDAPQSGVVSAAQWTPWEAPKVNLLFAGRERTSCAAPAQLRRCFPHKTRRGGRGGRTAQTERFGAAHFGPVQPVQHLYYGRDEASS